MLRRPQAEEIREGSLAKLRALGFVAAEGLALRERDALRPTEEIAARLMALDAIFTWVAFGEESASSERMEGYMERNDLPSRMTDEERAMLSLKRSDAHARHGDQIGWKLENMWGLAWVLGFEPAPGVDVGQLSDAISQKIMLEFLPGLEARIEDLIERVEVREAAAVVAMEDLFYCAHNAVRNAQKGRPTVPKGYHPVMDGGSVHERRHAFTWCLSPGVPWDKTDLST